MPTSKKRKGAKAYKPRGVHMTSVYRFCAEEYAEECLGQLSSCVMAWELKMAGAECTFKEIEIARHIFNQVSVTMIRGAGLFEPEALNICFKRVADANTALAAVVARAAKSERKTHYFAFPKEVPVLLDGLAAAEQVARIAIEDAPRLWFYDGMTADLMQIRHARTYNQRNRVPADEIEKVHRQFVTDRIPLGTWRDLAKFHDSRMEALNHAH